MPWILSATLVRIVCPTRPSNRLGVAGSADITVSGAVTPACETWRANRRAGIECHWSAGLANHRLGVNVDVDVDIAVDMEDGNKKNIPRFSHQVALGRHGLSRGAKTRSSFRNCGDRWGTAAWMPAESRAKRRARQNRR